MKGEFQRPVSVHADRLGPPAGRFGLRGLLTRLRGAILLATAIGLCILPQPTALAQDPAPLPESEVKAAFVFMLTRFVNWPEAVGDGEPFVVGMIGRGLFDGRIPVAFANKSVNGRPVIVREWDSIGEVGPADIVVISADYRRWTEQILRRVGGSPVLTIGDYPDFAARGGVIAFKLQNNRVALVVNRGAARAANLELSAKLLAVAVEVIE